LPGGGTAGVLALVGRDLCLYLHVDASKVPAKQRAAFVALSVRRAAPFADPDHDVLWLQGHAAVWYWSRERVRSLAGGLARYRAEAIFRGGVPRLDTVELLELETMPASGEAFVAGLEARAWRGGRLEASRWWPQQPDALTWQAFARGAGLDASQPAPEPVPAPLRSQPLNDSGQRAGLSHQLDSQRPMIAAAVATIVLALLAWQGASAARVAWRAHSVERQIDQLSASMEKIIAAREKADAARARIDAVLALHAPASQTRLLGEVKRITPGTWQLMAWSQPSPEVLEVTFRIAKADVSAIVAAWEASPLLQEVTPSTSNRADEVTLQAKLTPLAEQAP
jgi:hypothetical protein